MSTSGFGYRHKRITNPPEGAASAYLAVTSAADVLRFSPGAPCQVMRWGFIATTTVNDATAGHGLRLTCDLRPTAGSDTGRLVGGTFVVAAGSGYNASGAPAIYLDYGGVTTTLGKGGGTITVAASATQVLAGAGVFHNVWPQVPTGSTVASGIVTVLGGYYPSADTAFVPPGGVPEQFMVYPGQEVVIAVRANTVVPTAGAGIFFLELIEFPLTVSGNNNSGAVTGVPSSISPTPSNSGANLTLVKS